MESSKGVARDIDDQFAAIYKELRPAAVSLLRQSRQNTLTPTGLVNEAYIKLAASGKPFAVESPLHMKRLISKAMKQVLLDASRRKEAIKRGEGAVKITLDDQMEAKTWTVEQLLVFNEFLDQLRAQDARKADVVECRFYLGLSDQEITAELGISLATVERDWQFARAWLNGRMNH